jgi:hypothetical protein
MTEYACTCHGVEGAGEPDCLRRFVLPADEMPDTFCGDPICPPCFAGLKRTLANLKRKGVVVAVDLQSND